MRPSLLRLAVFVAVASTGCSHAWDDYDPRIGTGGSIGASGSTGVGGSSAVSTGPGATTTSGGATSGSSTVASGSGGAGGTGAAGGAGGSGAQPSCPVDGTNLVTDDFDDGVIDLSWTPYESPGIEITETGGELVIDIQPDPNAEQYGEIKSPPHVFENCQVAVHVTKLPPANTSGGLLITTTGAPEDRFEMSYGGGGNVGCMYWLNNVVTNVLETAYDPVAHAWWRIRESGGTTHFEASADGISYQPLISIPTPMPVTSMRVVLYGGALPDPGLGGDMHFDRLNLPP